MAPLKETTILILYNSSGKEDGQYSLDGTNREQNKLRKKYLEIKTNKVVKKPDFFSNMTD